MGTIAIGSEDIGTHGALTVAGEVAKAVVEHWLDAELQGGRSASKMANIEQVERSHRSVPDTSAAVS